MSEERLIPVSMIALIAGVFYEIKKIDNQWKTVLSTALTSFLFSFGAFLPGRNEREYRLESHISFWPYAFIVLFILMTIAINKKKVIAKLTEGTTLLLSIAVIYWILDFYSQNTLNLFLIILFSIVGLFTAFSIFNAFTKTELTRNNRFALSLWSSIVVSLFAIDNIYRVYQNNYIENSDLVHGCYIALQFFLLGVSSIYMTQNFLMLIGFLPEKHKFFNEQYFKDIKALKNDHIDRYSQTQIRSLYSSFCVIFASLVFYFNYAFQLLPRQTIIWIVFITFPILINLFDYFSIKKTTVNRR
jgi:hypothetical protein